LKSDEIDIGMDFDSVAKGGSMLGSGGVVVLDDTTCIVKFALRTMKFYQHESCGWCIPCREGTDWLKKTLIRFHAGGGVKKDIDNMYYSRKHARPDVLSIRGRGGDADHGIHQEIPAGV